MSTAEFNPTPLRGKQASRQATFNLPCSAGLAFSMFTPEGERAWVDGWDPMPIYPDQITFSTDTVFELFQEGERSIWTILKADSAAMEVEYIYIVLISRITRVRIKVQPVTPERCSVNVEYVVTGFTDAGDRFVDGFTAGMFSRKMQIWQQRLIQVLQQ